MQFDLVSLQDSLRYLPLGGILLFPELSSTNDYCLKIPQENIRDLTLVITNYQTAGRGRKNNRWISPKNSSLTFSVILLPSQEEIVNIGHYTALGSLAVVHAITRLFPSIHPLIKWPNDILVNNNKFCGVLTEISWLGDMPERIVIGIGINITKEAISSTGQYAFPVTCLENETENIVDGLGLLDIILEEIIRWRSKIGMDIFLSEWENNLAFRNEQVNIMVDDELPKSGVLLGITRDGSLRLLDEKKEEIIFQYGVVHLRPSV